MSTTVSSSLLFEQYLTLSRTTANALDSASTNTDDLKRAYDFYVKGRTMAQIGKFRRVERMALDNLEYICTRLNELRVLLLLVVV